MKLFPTDKRGGINEDEDEEGEENLNPLFDELDRNDRLADLEDDFDVLEFFQDIRA